MVEAAHQGTILLIEDEAPFAQALRDFLENRNYTITWKNRGDEGLAEAEQGTYDLIVLDRMLPGLTGIEVCKQLRQAGIITPIIFLTAKGAEEDRIEGLDAGADDYLPKPFSSAELASRIAAVLRRTTNATAQKSTSAFYKFGKNTLDSNTRELCHSGEHRTLTGKEYELLMYFLAHADRVITRAELLEHIWGYTSHQVTRTVDIHIGSLRHKIETDHRNPALLRTIHGQGYRFNRNI